MFTLPDDDQLHPAFAKLLHDACRELPRERNILGLMLLCYLAGTGTKAATNHVLLEGLNGVAKTTLVKALLRALAGDPLNWFFSLTGRSPFTRVQGGPDVSQADLLGFDLLAGSRLRLNLGPFLGAKLAHYFDELNRSPSKTQSAVLEPCAEGGNVTLTTMDEEWRFRRTFRLPAFFMVASQNPEHQEGVFPLPEAGLDRFMIKITVQFTPHLARLIRDGEPEFRDDLDESREGLIKLFKSPLFERPLLHGEKLTGPGAPSYVKWMRTQAPLAKLLVESPQWGEPEAIVKRLEDTTSKENVELGDQVEAFLTAQRHHSLDRLRHGVRHLPMQPDVPDFIADLVYNTWSDSSYREAVGGLSRQDRIPIPLRPDEPLERARTPVRQGASPRAAFALRDLSRAVGYCCRPSAASNLVKLADVHRIATPVLRHRVFLRFQDAAQGATTDDVITEIADFLYRIRGAGR